VSVAASHSGSSGRAAGDFECAEEAAQEAFAVAAERCPRATRRRNPRDWLIETEAWGSETSVFG
jgi:predicted RNA polymerase sigma factor